MDCCKQEPLNGLVVLGEIFFFQIVHGHDDCQVNHEGKKMKL